MTATLVFDHVTVVDVERGQLYPDKRVVIAGRRIRAIGSPTAVPIPASAHVIAGQGKYLIPGLWDLHAHNAPGVFNIAAAASVAEAADRYAIYLAYGITGVRDMGSSLPLAALQRWRRAVAAGQRTGPRVAFSGPYVDADKPPNWGSLAQDAPAALRATTIEEARRVVDTLKAAGADFIKLHDNVMPREVVFALLAEARRVGLPVGGHLPTTVSVAEASDSGMRSLEHLWSITGSGAANPCALADSAGAWPADSTGQENRRQCSALIAKLLRNNTWLSPNMGGDTVGGPRFVQAVRPFGLPFVVGTDFPITGAAFDVGVSSNPLPGAPRGVHIELQTFVKAGLTPAEALQTATLNPAKLFQATDSMGTIAPEKLADLVLLDADPLTDITNTLKIRAVVANGRYYDRAALDALMDAVRGRSWP